MALCLSQEYDPSKATFVKVVPTPNNGSTELVALHRDEVGVAHGGWEETPPGQQAPTHLLLQGEDGQEVLSFEFQKIKYSYDALEKKRFLPAAFPVGNTFSFYQSSRGFQEEAEIRAAEKKFGSNKCVCGPDAGGGCRGLPCGCRLLPPESLGCPPIGTEGGQA